MAPFVHYIHVLLYIMVTSEVAWGAINFPPEQHAALCPPIARDAPQSRATRPARPNARLPTTLHPVRYNLTLEPHLEPPWLLEGILELTFRVEEATDIVTLNMLDIITKNDTAHLTEKTRTHGLRIINITSQTYDPERQMYTAHLENPLEVGGLCQFRLSYEGLLNDKLVGFYRSSYITKDGEKRWLATTQFSPTDARRAFPGFDEPGFKSIFDISIIHPSNLTAKSNMPPAALQTLGGGRNRTHFHSTKVMSTFIVAFHVSDFVTLPPATKVGTTDFSVWSRPDVIQEASYAKSVGPPFLTFLEAYFNSSFPLPKLEMVAVPDFKFNGMENWGFITYRETAMLLEESDFSPDDKFRVAYVVAHEISHQWFGNLVTPSWWSELWLKEGFASFMGYLAMDAVEKEWDVLVQFVSRYQHSAMSLDSLASSHPINVPVNHPDEISEIFDKISYDKGASILRMLHNFVGPLAFRDGLTNYVHQLQYSTADQEDLWRHLTLASSSSLPADATVKTIMNSWTNKKGYPVVNVTRSNNSITLSQEQFIIGRRPPGVGWWIPVTFTDQQKQNFSEDNLKTQIWMTDDHTQIIEIDTTIPKYEWVTFNLHGTGFYRVCYEPSDWLLLGNQLQRNSSVFPPAHRSTLLDDAFNLARDGRVPYPVLLNMTIYLQQEQHYVPWEVCLRGFSFMYQLLKQDKAFGDLQSYLLSIVSPWYERHGFEDHPNATYPERSAREDAIRWACSLGHKNCVANAKKLFGLWLRGDGMHKKSVPLTGLVRSPVLCQGIETGSREVWETVWQRAITTTNPSVRVDLLQALGCTKHVWLLARYLDRMFTPSSGVRKQDALTAYSAVASNPAGRDLAWRYLRDNWSQLVDYFGSTNRVLGRLVGRLSSGFSSDQHLKELDQFIADQQGRLVSAERAVDQSRETTELNVRWMDHHYHTVTTWLKNNQPTEE